jgi:hypothetical protein
MLTTLTIMVTVVKQWVPTIVQVWILLKVVHPLNMCQHTTFHGSKLIRKSFAAISEV